MHLQKLSNFWGAYHFTEVPLLVYILTMKRERCILLLSYEVNGITGFTHKTANGSTTYYYRKNLLGLLRRSMTPRAYAKRSMRMTHGGIAR